MLVKAAAWIAILFAVVWFILSPGMLGEQRTYTYASFISGIVQIIIQTILAGRILGWW